MPLPGKQSKAKPEERLDQLFRANLCPGIRCSLCPLIFFNEHSLFIWVLPRACKDRGQSQGAQNRHEGRFHSWRLFTEVKFSGPTQIFSSNIMAPTMPNYPDTSPSQTWPSPDPVIPTRRTTYPLDVPIKCWRLPSSSVLSEPCQRLWCFYMYLPQQRKAPQPFFADNPQSLVHFPHTRRWEMETKPNVDTRGCSTVGLHSPVGFVGNQILPTREEARRRAMD